MEWSSRHIYMGRRYRMVTPLKRPRDARRLLMVSAKGGRRKAAPTKAAADSSSDAGRILARNDNKKREVRGSIERL